MSESEACQLRTALLCLLLVSGCATVEGERDPRDPWEGFNRGVYQFNETFDEYVARPVARGYAAARGFAGESGVVLPLPGPEGALEAVVLGLGKSGAPDPFLPGKLPEARKSAPRSSDVTRLARELARRGLSQEKG